MLKFSVLALIASSCAHLGAADWLTFGGDAQRTGWQKRESSITTQNVKDLQLLWKMKFENAQKGMYSIFEPLIVGSVITNHGFKEMAIVAGSSDNVWAIDADLGKLLWQKQFTYTSETPQAKNSSWLCPGGLTAVPVIPPTDFQRPRGRCETRRSSSTTPASRAVSRAS